MPPLPQSCRGLLLGLAVGDALGTPVDHKTYSQICEDYGPSGLLGYDLANGHDGVSSYTQVAAFTCNGLLLGLTRGQSGPAQCMGYVTLALKEWAKVLYLPSDPQRRYCWLSHIPSLRQRKCLDARALDTMIREVPGSLEKPGNQAVGPGMLTAAAMAGMFYPPDRMEVHEIGLLGARIVALTHGDPTAFLCGAVLAYAAAGILQEPEVPLKEQLAQALMAVQLQFGKRYPRFAEVRGLVETAMSLADDPTVPAPAAMDRLGCFSAPQVLAGTVYAVLAGGGDFDASMILAVNHSGKSAAVGALTGALLGAAMGEEALPDFYLESLPCAGVLRSLADDLTGGGAQGWQSKLFDDDWDRKYNQGLPVD